MPKIKLSFFDAENKSFSFQKTERRAIVALFFVSVGVMRCVVFVVCGGAATATKRCLKNFSFIVLFGDEEESSGWQSHL